MWSHFVSVSVHEKMLCVFEVQGAGELHFENFPHLYEWIAAIIKFLIGTENKAAFEETDVENLKRILELTIWK